MSTEILTIFTILALTLVVFLFGKWRHDMVAMASLLACVLFGLVPAADAFSGFGHPAVITVACVLVLSRMLQTSGAIDILTAKLIPKNSGTKFTIGALAAFGAVLSAFMNNVGALALLMPVALQLAAKKGLPPGKVLMPLSFGSILGGMTTLIGTPPNLIVSGFRAQAGLGSFTMFDFAPVGVAVAGAGLIFIVLFAQRLIPERKCAGVAEFRTGAYMTEVRIGKGSKTAGKTLVDLGPILAEADAQIVGFVRNSMRVTSPSPRRVLNVGDILILEAEPDEISNLLGKLALEMVEKKEDIERQKKEKEAGSKDSGETFPAEESDIELLELAVRPDTSLVGRNALDLELRTSYGINLVALSRNGKSSIRRLRSQTIRAGDVLLMQGTPGAISSFAAEFGCVPLAERQIRLPDKKMSIAAGIIMAGAVAGAAFGLLPAAIAFSAGVLAAMAFHILPLRSVYQSIDWTVIILLGALIPVAGAVSTTGAADQLAGFLLSTVGFGSPVVMVALLLVVTMTLSDFMNNAATAAVMCPIAISTAALLKVNPDSFLMAVAIGASCAFLTPIGHQNNTLILGPGGFRFGDYWKLGLPLEVLIVIIAVPLLLVFWPL